jgi:hypothetical protein
VIKAVTTIETNTPTAGMHNTNKNVPKDKTSSLPVIELPPITKAAHVDSANDPNKSALIPATSPTLSPTLSAIVAGFFGLS